MDNFYRLWIYRINNYKNLISNFSYLSISQFFSLILPLTTYTYLIRILGVELYGNIIFAQSILSYFIMFINFGFNISGTQNIATFSSNIDILSKAVSSILFIKGFFFLVSFLIFVIATNCLNIISDQKTLLYLTFLSCFYEAFYPIWYFQGIQKLKVITYVNILFRILIACLIFIFIKNKSDYLLVPIFNFIGGIIVVFVAFYILMKIEKIKFKFHSIRTLYYFFKKSTIFFISSSSSILFSRTNMVLIGHFFGAGELAYFDLSSKIVEVLKYPFNILNQVVFPHVVKNRSSVFIRKIIILNLLYSTFTITIIAIFTKNLFSLIGISNLLIAQNFLHILLFTIPISGVSYFLGNTLLLVFGFKKELLFSTICQLFFYLFCVGIILIFDLNTIYAYVFSFVLAIFLELLIRLYFTFRYKLWN